jgi:hypothetical protein
VHNKPNGCSANQSLGSGPSSPTTTTTNNNNNAETSSRNEIYIYIYIYIHVYVMNEYCAFTGVIKEVFAIRRF